MPKTTRSVAEVDAVRERILECAFDIAAKHGFEALSMGRIGARMKMTAANLYNYVGNKDELLIAIHKKAYSMLYDKLRKAAKKAKTPVQRYEGLMYAFVDFGIENAHLYDIMFNRPIRQHSDYIGTPQEQLSTDEFRSSLRSLRLAIKVISQCREATSHKEPADPKFLAIQCAGALHGVISLHNSGVLAQITDDVDAVLDKYVRDIMCFVTG